MDAASLNPRFLQYNGSCQDLRLSEPIGKKVVRDSAPKHTPYQMQADIVHSIPPGSFASHTLISSTVDTLPTSSVWLEQGEYFFDDEFAETMDPHMQGDGDDNARYPLMVQSMDCNRKSPLDLVGHSRSDSCIFSPVNSRESDLSNSKITENHLANISNCENTSSFRNAEMLNNIKSNNIRKNLTESKIICLETDRACQASNEINMADLNNDVNQKFPNESQGSVHYSASGSTSWMHMLMERSCNPELRALINRTAAAVDYKLAYGDSIALQGRLEDRSCRSSKYNASGFGPSSRSLSQGSLLAVASLAGLRHALNQTTQLLPKPIDRNTELCSVGVSADLISETVTTNLMNQDSTTSNTTTWAKKHGSRESLKRRSLRSTDMTVFPYPNLNSENEVENDHKTAWQTIKDANGALITWNQLKCVIKRAESLGKSSCVRESRRDQHNQSEVFVPKPNMTGSVKNRSHSQPLDGACHMHRFSGTLFEIFMQARAQGANSGGSDIDLNASFQKGNCVSAYSNPAHTIHQGDSDNMDVDRHNRPLGVAISPRVLGARKSYHFVGMDPRSIMENDKYLLLRKDKVLPNRGNIQFSPLYTSADAVARSMRNFGAQFPPLEDSKDIPFKDPFSNQKKAENIQNNSPIWSTKLPLRNGSSAAHANNFTVRHSHPQPLYLNRPLSALQCHENPKRNGGNNIQQSSPINPPNIAACLTASAGPDSPYMAALRAGCAARGYAVGWIGNPRASIAYPGLGLLSVPRPSRLAGSAFLSHTLPDLSFLSQAGAEEDRKGTPTMTKRRASCLSTTQSKKRCTCTKCGCRSTSAGRVSSKSACSDKSSKLHAPKVQPVHNKAICRNLKDNEHRNTNATNIVPTLSRPNPNDANTRLEMQTKTQDRSHCPEAIERSSSEPDLINGSTVPNQFGQPMMYGSVDSGSSWIASTTRKPHEYHPNGSNSRIPYGAETENGLVGDSFTFNSRPKKSVSFSGNIRLLQLTSKDSHNHYSDTSAQPSPEPKVIPRNWGLYGQEQPLAEFNPRCSPSLDDDKTGKLTRRSDIDVRYHAMVNDVIKAVQETVAYYCNPNMNTKIEAIGSSGRQPLLAVVPPLTILLCDGLLPPSKPIFTSRPRTRLWQLVEESCRPGSLPTGVAYHVLNDAISQVKSLTNVTLEKTKFKGFICACLNAKALPMWLNALVANDTLLRRFYCEDAFIRQCRSGQRELHADLMTHLEQLLAFPFNLDISIEVRKPLTDPQLVSNNNNSTKASIPSSAHLSTNLKQHLYPANHRMEPITVTNNNKTARSNIPPATVVTRRHMLLNGNNPNSGSRIPSVSPIQTTLPSKSLSSTTTLTPNNHCYPQHHLPTTTQRPISSRLPSASNSSKSNLRSSIGADNDSEASTGSCLSTETGDLVHSKAYNNNNTISPENTVSSQVQVRGRFKNALSNLRRNNNDSHVIKSNTRTLISSGNSSSILNTNNGKPNNTAQMTDSQRRTITPRQSDAPNKINSSKSQVQKSKPSSNPNISGGGGTPTNIGRH
ncbi:RUN and SH3 domain-containing protein isoform 2 [Schistosoma japonicum]|uniref:RUN and SH3 domain-containing protein isoform 2 n=2 Tax=Schistosoma japonicum TaxID=6182 RepID=A0A4Z2D3L8_SCHJA|nr:RUN and SH3 domain-containing protein isoform 2 [Schistosoma japonicum]